jgi:hypothetical protein
MGLRGGLGIGSIRRGWSEELTRRAAFSCNRSRIRRDSHQSY